MKPSLRLACLFAGAAALSALAAGGCRGSVETPGGLQPPIVPPPPPPPPPPPACDPSALEGSWTGQVEWYSFVPDDPGGCATATTQATVNLTLANGRFDPTAGDGEELVLYDLTDYATFAELQLFDSLEPCGLDCACDCGIGLFDTDLLAVDLTQASVAYEVAAGRLTITFPEFTGETPVTPPPSPRGIVAVHSLVVLVDCLDPEPEMEVTMDSHILAAVQNDCPPPREDCCTDGRPSSLTFRYTGEDCSATSHGQDPSKVACAGDPALEARVQVIANSKADLSGDTWFDGIVDLGDTFTIDAANAGRTQLGATTFMSVRALDGTWLQDVEFHTSCSQPLFTGDQFGSFLLVGCSSIPGDGDSSSDDGSSGTGPGDDSSSGASNSGALPLGGSPDEDDSSEGYIVICHYPPGDPENFHTIIIPASALAAHLAHGDTIGPCEPTDDDSSADRVTICHHPPENPDNTETIMISVEDLPFHLGHGDTLGPCDSTPPPDDCQPCVAVVTANSGVIVKIQ